MEKRGLNCTKKTRKSGQGYLFSHIFKPITTARRQVTMKRIACTIERVGMEMSINIISRIDVRLIKAIETWKGSNLASNILAERCNTGPWSCNG